MFCGVSVEHGASLTLDHIKPLAKGGTNQSSNLLTCCNRCNNARGRRSIAMFARDIAIYIGHKVTAQVILKSIRKNVRLSLEPYKKEAKLLIAHRGAAAQVLM